LRVTPSRSAATLSHDAATLLFGASSPHPIAFAGSECVLQTRLANRTTKAYRLGHLGFFV
jgi:hypothetical protein